MGHKIKTYLSIDVEREEERARIERALYAFTRDVQRAHHFNHPDGYNVRINTVYDVDVNVMYRKTLKPFIGYEKELKKLSEALSLSYCLEAVVELDRASDDSTPILAPDPDIIAFCYHSGVQLDIDLYLV